MRIALVFVVLFITGITTIASSASSKAKIEQCTQDFNNMTKADFKKGDFVNGMVYEIYDEFAYTESYNETYGFKHNSRVTSHYYIVPMVGSWETDTPLYVGVEIGNTKLNETAQSLMYQTWDYMDYGTEPEVWDEFYITGKIEPLEGELLDYFYECMLYGMEDATRADVDPYICPYIISYVDYDGVSSGVGIGIVMLLIGGAGIGIFVFVLIKRNRPTMAAVPSAGVYDPASAPANNGLDNETLAAMNRLRQPENNADDFFARTPAEMPAPEAKAEPAPQPAAPPVSNGSYMDMDEIDTSALGIGIGDDE